MAEPFNDNQDSIIEEAVRQFIDAKSQGGEIDIDEFVKQYPGLENQIRENIQELKKINTLFDCLSQAGENDFQETASINDLVGKKIGGFEIIETIGRGGMGVVYLARDTKLDRSVAVKSIPVELQANETTRQRFRREAKLLASLNHPNIAVIHEIVEQDEGTSFLILEYVPGETLAERIAREPLTLEATLSIGQQIAEAISAAHENNVVHRDLKPGNIKITPDGKVKVLDFGLAKATQNLQTNEDSVITQPGRVIGTPSYMSPEQARGKPADHRTDIWSFGCIMYEMLTRHLPFEGETATDTLAKIIERQPDWEALPKQTPENIRVLLRRCLEKDPQRRLRDIGDAAIEISETLNLPKVVPPVTSPSSASLVSKAAPESRTRRTVIILVAAVVLLALIVKLVWKNQPAPASKQIRLVVLPFENLGKTGDEYFADGITDAITARLAGIHGLGVISRQSAIQYKNRKKSTKQIAKELRVDYILEGTVQCERPSDPNSQVRIIPQLIRASDDTHIWAQTYDDNISEVFRFQSELAECVAQALDITLLEPERKVLTSRPTENMEAYDYYLRGRDYFNRSYLENDVSIAIQMCQKAVMLDPTFALAYALLSRAHGMMYWHSYDRSKERIAMAKQAVDKALQYNPDLPQVHLALGHYYYHCHLDYDNALQQFEIVRKNMPNNAELLSWIGYVQRRQGKFEQAVASLIKASELDPLSTGVGIGETLVLLRKYPEAEHYYDLAISLSPDVPLAYSWKAWLYLIAEGNIEKARADLEVAVQNIGSLEHHAIIHRSVLLDMFDEKYQNALSKLSSWALESFDTHFYSIPKALLCAQINGLMGNRKLEQASYQSARKFLESQIAESPEDARLHSSLGLVYAGLDRKEDAVREGKLAVELMPLTKDAWRGLYHVDALARIYVMVGKYDLAMDQIEFLLDRPSELSIPLLRLDPAWHSLRNHPRFKKLIQKDI